MQISSRNESEAAVERSLFRSAASFVRQPGEHDATQTPPSATQADPAGSDHDHFSQTAAAEKSAVYEAPTDAENGLVLTGRQNSVAQSAAQTVFARQLMQDCMRGIVLPHSHSVHDAIEEQEIRRRLREHHITGGNGLTKRDLRAIEAPARVSAFSAKNQVRLHVLRLAHEAESKDARARALRRHFNEQQNFVDSLSHRQFQRELHLRSLLAARENVAADNVARQSALRDVQLQSPAALTARVFAIMKRVLGHAHTNAEYRAYAPHLPQLLNLLADSAARDAAFSRLRIHAQTNADALENQQLLVNLADSLPMLGHGSVKRRQLQALRGTPKATSDLLHALFSHVEGIREPEIRDAELYDLILAHARSGVLPRYTFAQKIDMLVDQNLQRRAMQAIGLPDA